jgi:protease IV
MRTGQQAYGEVMHVLPGRAAPILLELDLTALPVDPPPGDRLARLRSRGQHQLRPTLRALHEAARDRRVSGLIAKVGGELPWAGMQEIRRAVTAFAGAGKPTLAWAESFGEGAGDTAAYVLATAFDEIWVQPGGMLGLLGVGVETTFVRGALDRLGIEPQIEQRYEYKNAADRIMRTGFTEPHRIALDRLAESVFSEAVTEIAAGRGLDADETRSLLDSGPRTAAEARDARLIDSLGYRDEAYQAIRDRVGSDTTLLYADRWRGRRQLHIPRPHQGTVALVSVRGTIASGRSRRAGLGQVAGSDTVSAALRAAADDDSVRAVVLHVDSPGGSAVASEVIWREVCLVRATSKPLIVSMGALAASGGYYVACPADVIVALPATLTGSIGVFGGKIVVRDLLERIGLNTGSVNHGARALMFSARRPFTDDEQQRLAATIDAVYQDFLTKVSDGRGMANDQVEQIARGRVWTGSDALGNGLVDELGGLRDALRIARSRADLPDDAPVRSTFGVPLHRRLRPPRNSEDPRAATAGVFGQIASLADVASVLGLPSTAALRMPDVSLR